VDKKDKKKIPLYGKLAIARTQIVGMDDDGIFQDWLEKFFGVRSPDELSYQQLKRLVDLFERMGAKCAGKAKKTQWAAGAGRAA
jgi:hypothetical protein